MVIPYTKKLMLAIECILNLWKEYFVIYISATVALYSKMYSFGITLVIWSVRYMLKQTVRFIV